MTMPMSRPEAADPAPFDARDQVFAILSHEIRTPLNGVLGMAGLLAGTTLDATQAAYLTTLRECGEHLLGLVNDMLDLAKLDSGRVELEPVDTDVERLLQGVCELLSPKAHARGIEIAWACSAGMPPIRADDGRLRQILFNLAGNAVKLTRRGGVLVRADAMAPARPDGVVPLRFSVRDTGPGLAADQCQRVFDAFVQTDAGAQAGGAGLGLAIVKRLAEAFGGRVGVESVLGHGAVFWFEAMFDVAGVTSPPRSLEGLVVGIRSPSPVLRDAAARQIEACGGRAVRATSAAERWDLLLADGVSARPRQRPKGAAPALVLLAPEDRDRIPAYRRAGYAGYLIKPLRRTSVAARVLAALRDTSGRDDPPDERTVVSDGRLLRTLLAEDNPINAMLARALLTRNGCVVDHVPTGELAVAAARRGAYDLVLMDMRMPGMSGLEAARALRASGVSAPIVALTANAFEDDRRACRDAGMDDFLTKPLLPTALEAVLARCRAA